MLRTLLLCATAGPLILSLNRIQDDPPPRRAHHSMIYDESRGAVLMMGGSTPLDGGQRFDVFNDIWVLGDSGWRLAGRSGEPMSSFALAFDSDRKEILSFGGYTGQAVGVMRRLEGNQWTILARYPEMPVAEAGFVYDAKRKKFVSFGGSSGPAVMYDKTMEYDGTGWTTIEVAGPSARQAHAMVYDGRRGKTVLFGGMARAPQGQRPPSLGDTWEYDGQTWVKREVDGPSARHAAGIAYDSKRGLVILFGGAGENGFQRDTWSWDGTSWKQLATGGPEARAMGYLAYDKKRDRVVLFGGRKGWPNGDLSDTWEWDGKNWIQRAR